MGTTATGKTDAAAYLSEQISGEIISVDSSLVYRGMDIGTAKPDADFLAKYPHHLVDVRLPNQTFSVADFYQHATVLIKQISERGKIPILVGGTHFYFNSLQQGLPQLPPANVVMRAQITEQAKQDGWSVMHQKLANLDAASAARIDIHDAQRIQRALEIVMQSGKTVAEHNANRNPPISNPILNIALAYSDRTYLHKRIEQRFTLMLEQGLQKEVEGLLQDEVDPQAASMRMIGYRQMLEFLRGECNHKEMQNRGIVATRQLAKRQLTWLRNQSNIVWWVDFGLKQQDFTALSRFVNYCL